MLKNGPACPCSGRGLMLFATMFAVGGLVLSSMLAHAEPADDNKSLAGKNVVFLVAEGFHDGETLYPMGYLVNRGAKVTVIGIEPAVVKAYNSDVRVVVQKAVGDVAVDQFDAMVIPGGRSPAALREHDAVVGFARDFFNTGKPVAAICHGPQVLVTAGVLEGYNATCVAGISSELTEAGAVYEDKAVIHDRNLITSRLPRDLAVFCATIEKALIGTVD